MILTQCNFKECSTCIQFPISFLSGTNPSELYNKRIGVYMAATICDSESQVSSPFVSMGLVG